MSAKQGNSLSVRSRERILHVEEYYDLLAYEIDPLGGYRLRRNQQLPHITINRYGYRGDTIAGSERILLLGDSVTFGVGASNNHSRFPRFLEAYVGEPIADASVRAYRVCQHYAQLPRLLELLPQVKLVLLWCGYADLLFWARTGGCVEGAFQFEWKYASQSRSRATSSRLLRLLERANWFAVGSKGDHAGAEERARETGTIDDLITHLSTYIRAIRDICSSRAINMDVLIQPFLRSRPTDSFLQALADEYNDKTREKCGRGWYEISLEFVNGLLAALTDQGFHCIDCQALISETDYLDQVHIREEALDGLAMRLVQDRLLRIPWVRLGE